MLRRALSALRAGIPVLIHDSESREDEVDYVVHGSKIGWDKILEMRRVAGGLICFAMPYEMGRVLGLDFQSNLLTASTGLKKLYEAKTPYGNNPSFSISVNSLRVRTGIRDRDRATTISVLNRVVELLEKGKPGEAWSLFMGELYAPGHVPILLGLDLSKRQGHTELSLELARLANMPPGVVLVEMLSDDGEQLSPREARRLADARGWVYLEAGEIVTEHDMRVMRG